MGTFRAFRSGPYAKGQVRKVECPAGEDHPFALAWEVVFQRDQDESKSLAEEQSRQMGLWQLRIFRESSYERKRFSDYLSKLDDSFERCHDVVENLVLADNRASKEAITNIVRSIYMKEEEIEAFTAFLRSFPVRSEVVTHGAPKLHSEARRLLRKRNYAIYKVFRGSQGVLNGDKREVIRTIISIEPFDRFPTLALLA